MRFPPIPQSEWTHAQREVASAIVDGPRGELRGPFVPLLHAPAIAGRVQALGETIRFGTSIPNALLEIAVCMTARRHDCPNIWESHSKLAAKAGVATAILTSISERQIPAGMSPHEALVHTFCSELLDMNKVADATFDAVIARWGRSGAMELASICGYYGMLACVLNTAERPLVSPESIPFGTP